jgi:hypothetical protein
MLLMNLRYHSTLNYQKYLLFQKLLMNLHYLKKRSILSYQLFLK